MSLSRDMCRSQGLPTSFGDSLGGGRYEGLRISTSHTGTHEVYLFRQYRYCKAFELRNIHESEITCSNHVKFNRSFLLWGGHGDASKQDAGDWTQYVMQENTLRESNPGPDEFQSTALPLS